MTEWGNDSMNFMFPSTGEDSDVGAAVEGGHRA